MNISFDCPRCRQPLSTDASASGHQVKCPRCSEVVTVPPASPGVRQDELNGTMFCPKCGQRNQENNFKCTHCGFILHGPPQPAYVVVDDSTLGGLIPHKNPHALWAYYLGVFSLIPCFAIPLGIAALILGIKGLKFARQYPDKQGKVHAWIGIVLGSLCAVVNILVLVVPVVLAARAAG